MTGQQMCEFIADVLQESTGKTHSPKDIWNMSPTGELWPVYDLYSKCRTVRLMSQLRAGAPILPLDPRTAAYDDLIYFIYYGAFPPPASIPSRLLPA